MGELGSLSDGDLVERTLQAGGGDTRAFETLVSRYQHRVVTNCRFISRSAENAPDLAQEIFVKVFFSLKKFEGRAQFSTWLNRIKVNHCINFLRKEEGKIFVSADDPDAAPEPELTVQPEADRRMAAADTERRIQQALDGLPDTLRIPLVLREFDGFSYQEIADQLGVGLSAVKMRIKRGREEFRRGFERSEADTGMETDH